MAPRSLAQTSPTTFAFTGAEQTFTVPAGVTSLNVVANGAQGTNAGSRSGGTGGKVEADLAVTPGQVLTLYVGGQNGYNGGGNSNEGGKGGGATDVRIGGTNLTNRVLVAGGGGGAGFFNAGGAGGGLIGGNSPNDGGVGGTQSQGGDNGISTHVGSSGQGGSAAGGGGGGGFYGGSGGRQDTDGGGGGSSYTDATLATDVVHTQGANTGDGSLMLSWAATTLPVTLAYFNGRMTDAGALLGWATAREDNNAGFRIERSRDATAFESIGTVPSQSADGNSLSTLTYTFTDAQPLAGVSYYRLLQTDRDGTQTRSKIVALSQESALLPVLFPNPVSAAGEAVIDPAVSHNGYQISDVSGRIVQRVTVPGVLSRVSLAGLSAGVYVLRIETEGGAVQTFRVVR